MTISKELFLAILSMDAYNRGYGAGIADGGANDPDGLGDSFGTRIGAATITQASDSDPLSDEVTAGFYAVAYDTPYGKVISYRGTDGGWDYLKGWLIGGGLVSEWTQADEALEFYTAVTGQSTLDGPATGTIKCQFPKSYSSLPDRNKRCAAARTLRFVVYNRSLITPAPPRPMPQEYPSLRQSGRRGW